MDLDLERGSVDVHGDWCAGLISKYDVSGPRYTSYPTAPQFSEHYTETVYREQAKLNLQQGIAPLSLYVHVPFCQNICYYCACNKVVTGDYSVARTYLDYLHKEIELQSTWVGRHRPVTQLHFGGGTPTFLDGAELTELMHALASHYNLTDSDRREYSIEIDISARYLSAPVPYRYSAHDELLAAHLHQNPAPPNSND